jgi:hypothetical protein
MVKTESRGIFLTLDALLALSLSVLALGFVAFYSYAFSNPSSLPLSLGDASSDIFTAVSRARLSELQAASPTLQSMHANGSLSDDDMGMTLSELLVRLAAANTTQSLNQASGVIAESVGRLSQGGTKFSVSVDGNELYRTSASKGPTVAVASGLEYSRVSTSPFSNPIGPSTVAVAAWSSVQ